MVNRDKHEWGETMSTRSTKRARLLLLATAIAGTAIAQSFPPLPVAHEGANVSVLATGLQDPRGIALGPAGSLYLAERGTTEGASR
jgi:glucose/arabinose dehydrogenase